MHLRTDTACMLHMQSQALCCSGDGEASDGEASENGMSASAPAPHTRRRHHSASASMRTPAPAGASASEEAHAHPHGVPPATAPPMRRRRARRPASANTAASSAAGLSSSISSPANPIEPLSAPPATAIYRNAAFVPFPDADVPTHASAPADAARPRSTSGSHLSAGGGSGLAALEALRDRLELWRTSPIPPLPDPGSSAVPGQLGEAGRGSARASTSPAQSTPLPGGGGSIGPLSLPGSRTVSFMDTPQPGQWQDSAAPNEAGAVAGDGGGGSGPTQSGESEAEILERLRGPMSAWHAAHAQDGKPGTAWQKIPDLLIKYGGPGQLMGHQDVWSDDGEPEEMDAPPLRPGVHSPTGRIRHVSQAVYQAQELRAARQSTGAPGSAVGGMSSLGADGGYGSGAEEDEEPWLKVQQMSESSTPVADLAKRLAHIRSRRG